MLRRTVWLRYAEYRDHSHSLRKSSLSPEYYFESSERDRMKWRGITVAMAAMSLMSLYAYFTAEPWYLKNMGGTKAHQVVEK